MKIAISATGPTLDDKVDPRFGRCQCFIIIDPETMEFEAVDNSSGMAAAGAGISTAQMIANRGVQAVLTGNCGPNAYQVLSSAGIKVITGASGKIADAVQGYQAGKFQANSQPNVPGHFGIGSGMGMGAGMMPPVSPVSEPESIAQQLQALNEQSQAIAQQLADIQQRLKDLENKEK